MCWKSETYAHSFHQSLKSVPGDPFQPFWRITLAWVNNGDDQPPYQHRDEENLLPPLDGTQQSLFGGDTDLSQGLPKPGCRCSRVPLIKSN